MKLLAIDSTTEVCSVALLHNNKIQQRYQWAPRLHAKLLLSFIDTLLQLGGLKLNQLDGIAVGNGPGSFTGLRIAMSVAQGLAFGADLPILPVSSLQALSWLGVREFNASHVIPAIDARMQEVYWGEYALAESNNSLNVIQNDTVTPPQDVRSILIPGTVILGIGSGWSQYESVLAGQCQEYTLQVQHNYYPEAQDIARIAQQDYVKLCTPAEQAQLNYCRNKVTHRG